MEAVVTTYEDFYNLAQSSNEEYYVKTPNGQLTPIRAVGKKIADTWTIEFENGYIITCADKHAFANKDGSVLFADDVKPGDVVQTISGELKVVSKSNYKKDQTVYDISIDDPHWYVNDEVGIVHHNTMYSLICARAYLDKFEDAVMLFYDSEMGAGSKYFESLGIDPGRVLHVPITDIEQLKFDIMAQLDEIKRGDHVIIVVDSIGNLASKKEVDDALSEKSSADMTRAKQLKSIFRMVTPHLNLKNVPMIVIGHTYQDVGSMYPKVILSGGTGVMYSANTVLYVSRSSEKKGTDLVGYNFNLNVMKGRFTREKAKIPVTVLFEGGLNVWSGLLEMAVASGDVIKPSNGWYQVVDPDTGEILGNKMRAADTNTREFWEPIMKRKHFKDWIERTFSVSSQKLITDGSDLNSIAPSEEFTMNE